MMKRVVIILMAAMLATAAWAEEEEVVRCVCPLTPPSGAIAEAESCGVQRNGGCNVNVSPRLFQNIPCPSTICGKIRVKTSNPQFYDDDWYRVTVTGTDSVLLVWKVVAEFGVRIKIIAPGAAPDTCSERETLRELTIAACDTAEVSVCVVPGVYYLEVKPTSTSSSIACDNGDYIAWVTCSPCHPEPPCPVPPPRLVEIRDHFCLEFCGEPIKVFWCCPLEGRPVFTWVPGCESQTGALGCNVDCEAYTGPLLWTAQWDSSNSDCPAPGGWWSAEFVADGEGCVCVFFDRQLAVEMGDFDAIPGDNRVTLRWNTVSESNNDRFDIERDGAVVARPRSSGDSPGGHSYQWVDENVQSSVTYTYKLYSVDLNGTRRDLATASATPSGTPATITEYALNQNYPNPFNPTTQISFDLVEGGPVTLTIFNPMGQMVTKLVDGSMTAGHHTVSFDAAELPTGMYLYRLESGSFTAARKMLLIK